MHGGVKGRPLGNCTQGGDDPNSGFGIAQNTLEWGVDPRLKRVVIVQANLRAPIYVLLLAQPAEGVLLFLSEFRAVAFIP